MMIKLYYLISCIIVIIKCASIEKNLKENQNANVIKSYMNFSVDPCDDFYKYSCGNWAKANHLNLTHDNFNVISVLEKKVDIFLKEVIFNNKTITKYNISSLNIDDVIQKAQDYYSSCKAQKLPSYEPYLNMLGVPGGWPILNGSWSEDHFDWLNVSAHFALFGNVNLFEITVGTHFDNVQKNIISIFRADFPVLRRNDYLYAETLGRTILHNIMVQSFITMGVNKTYAKEAAEDILRFEIELARISPSDEEEENHEEMTLGTLSLLVPYIDWSRFLQIVSGKTFDSTQCVLIYNRQYFEHLVTLLKNTKSTIIANYFLYKFALHVSIIPAKFEQYCTNEVTTHMGSILGSVYTKVHFDENTNKDVSEMVENIKKSFKINLESFTWMENSTKARAMKKVDMIISKIGAPVQITNASLLRSEYEDLEIDPNDYYRNYFNVLAHTTKSVFKNLNKINNREEWLYNSALVNAYYDVTYNSILIPTILLQFPVYDFHLPQSIKYGQLGSIIGHEIIHSLDETGRTYDFDGQVRNWWDDTSEKEYNNRTDCLVAQYNNYLKALQHTFNNGRIKQTLDENIADNGGIRHSYQAYKTWLKENEGSIILKDETLPGVNLTNIQLFFVGFAHFFCSHMQPVRALVDIIMDEHSPSRLRVIGTLSNFNEFSNAFSCPVGSKMNPEKKCRVW